MTCYDIFGVQMSSYMYAVKQRDSTRIRSVYVNDKLDHFALNLTIIFSLTSMALNDSQQTNLPCFSRVVQGYRIGPLQCMCVSP